jgi:7,8-dihydroneopterin aldolase/epimerase/oxygenase
MREHQYRIRVKDFVLMCSVGAYPHERLQPQRVRFNVDLAVRWPARPLGDELDNVVNYKGVTDGIRAIVAAGHINLVETLAERIADMCLADPRVLDARVGVEKLDVEPAADGIGIEIERCRPSHPAVTDLFSRLVATPVENPNGPDRGGER